MVSFPSLAGSDCDSGNHDEVDDGSVTGLEVVRESLFYMLCISVI